MPAGQAEPFSAVVRFDALSSDKTSGAEWRGKNEREWCEFIINRSHEWLPVVGIEKFDRVEVEYQVGRRRETGAPRFDAVGWVGETAHIIEAKVKCGASEMMGGVGQLLFYRTVAEAMGWKIGRLILASPAWPRLFAETVFQNRMPVDLVRLTPEDFTAIRSQSYGSAKG